MKCHINTAYRILNDECTEYLEVGNDIDENELIVIRSFTVDKVLVQKIIMAKEEAEQVYIALGKMLGKEISIEYT